MKQQLKQKALTLPLLPGVYLMKDREGSIIYVGKSKHLRKRVTSYFTASKNRPRKVERMIRQIADFEYIITDTELDALLLECDLIKQIRPLYNKLLKNDHQYRYIHLREEEVPFFESTYDRKGDGLYFGPYDMKREIDEAIAWMNEYYGLMQCENKWHPESCIALLRKKCLAPCHAETLPKGYREQINRAIAFLKNETTDILAYYQRQMKEAVQKLEFERAAQYNRAYLVLSMLSYREEAIAWSLSSTKTIAFVPMPDERIKVYFLFGSEIIRTQVIKKKRVLKKWASYFEGKVQTATHLSKNEIDRAYIIYTYLRRHETCDYVEIE